MAGSSEFWEVAGETLGGHGVAKGTDSRGIRDLVQTSALGVPSGKSLHLPESRFL